MIGLVDAVVGGEIVARRETGSGAAQDRDRNPGIAVGLLQHLEDLTAQAVVQRVALLGAVQRDAADARTRIIDDDVLVAHGSSRSQALLPLAK
ncbi:hypothetical protein ABIE93_001493 [Bradyrhizobium elkanii]